MADIEEKENQNLGEVVESEVLIEASDEERGAVESRQASPVKKARSKWDEIDAWGMDFEEVGVWERSSEKDAR